MLGRGSAQNMDPEKGPFLHVEELTRQLGQLLLEVGTAMIRDVLDREPFVLPADQFVQIEEPDRGLLVDDGEGGPQRVLAGDDAPERSPEGVDVEIRAHRSGSGNVVGGASPRELMRIPEHLLTV